MKVIIKPNAFPVCACGTAATQKMSSIWVCDKCIAIDAKEIGRRTHCGVPYVGVQGVASQKDWDNYRQTKPEEPIVGGSLKYLEAMLA